MDFILETLDTYVFDRIYANVLPIRPSASTFDPVSTIAATFGAAYNASNSYSTIPGMESEKLFRSSWQFEPASQSFSSEPSEYAYLSRWDRDNIWRQALSLYFVTWFFGLLIYFVFATLSYIFVFDKETFKHPKYLKNQIRLEIKQTLESVPIMAIFTVPFFVAEVRGHGYMYDTIANAKFSHPLLEWTGSWYNYIQFPLFLMFTDFFIYWIHRALHHPILYRRLHKPHHKWIMPTPFASLAFHPLDGYSQSVPYHLFPFIFPLQKFAYIGLFTFIQIWSIIIHDGEYVANSPIINGAACHTMHHLYFNYNYGQFTTLWDRLGGSYRKPNDELFVKEKKMSDDEWKRQTKEMEKMVVEVEGKDDRSYGPPESVVKKVQ